MSTIPISEPRATVIERFTEGTLATPIMLTLSQDEDWSPRIRGDLTAPLRLLDDLAAPGGSIKLGKLQGDYLTLKLETWHGPGLTCADVSELGWVTYGGDVQAVTRALTRPWHPGELIRPVSAATLLWGGTVATVTAVPGEDIASLTRVLRQPGGSYDIRPTDTQIVRVRRRKETPNELDGTMTIEFVGEDIRLHDFKHTGTTAYVNFYTSLRGLVEDVLGKIAKDAATYVAVQLAGGDDLAIASGQEWKPAQTAWDFLHPILESVGWQLYADLHGIYRLEPRVTKPAPHPLDAAVNLIDFQRINTHAESYYDAAMIEYTDADADIPTERWDVFAPPGSQRIAHETRPGTRAIPGAAEHFVERAKLRGTPGVATATVQIGLAPGQRVQFITPWRTEYATVQAITHHYPNSETTFDLRGIAAI